MKKYVSGELSQLELRDVSVYWREVKDSVGYPSLPFDSVMNKVVYPFYHSLDGISREIIVNRVFEWAAVTFGNTGGLLTQQGHASRLIVNGSIEVLFQDLVPVWKNGWKGYVETELQNSGICTFTMVFTIREGRMKSQVMNISYEYTDHLANRSVSRTLESCFPITGNEQKQWKSLISLVKETRAGFEAMTDQLVGYIRDYEIDYNW
jgi:hypothetical protein